MSQIQRRLLMLAAVLAALWGTSIALAGGIVFWAPWGRVSSRDPMRPFALTAAAGLWYYLRFRQHWSTDAGRLARVPWASAAAGVLALAALVIGIRWGAFVAGGSDSSGYVSQAEMWTTGELTKRAPSWAADAPWPDAVWSSAPLGYRAGVVPLTIVPTYSPGLPLILALFQTLGGPDAVYYAIPLFGMLTVWLTYRLGVELGEPLVGVMAGALMLSSPAFLVVLVQTMSDVPAAALWSLAIYAALQPRRHAGLMAGVAVSLAILVRPNLAPLAAVVALVRIARGTTPRDVLLLAVGVVPSILVVGELNNYWYGSPLRSGYGTLDYIYSSARVWPNLQNYSRWLVDSQTAAVVLALAAPIVIHDRARRALVAIIVVVFPVILMGLYLPYLTFGEWWYVRFLLPAYPALAIGVAAAIVTLARRWLPPVIGTAAAVVLGCLLVRHGFRYSDPFGIASGEQRYLRMAEYVRTLPPGAVMISLSHSGSLSYYTRRSVLRWEVLAPAYLDAAIDHLVRRGHDVYLAADNEEIAGFRQRFSGATGLRRLDTDTPVDVGGAVVYRLAPAAQP